MATKKGESPSASYTLTLDAETGFASAYAEGRFLERTLNSTAAQGFSAHKAVRTAWLPIGGRLHEARLVWNLVSRDTFVQGVVNHGYRIRWSGERLQVPYDGRNPPTSKDEKEILDYEVKAMLCYARPKKKLGKLLHKQLHCVPEVLYDHNPRHLELN